MSEYDKSLEYNADTQTLIGSQMRRLVDTDTGEMIEVEQVTKRIYGQKAFWKLYLSDFLSILGILDSKQVDVLITIMDNAEPATNTFVGTYNRIVKLSGASRPTVAKVMKKLQENKFIEKIQNGVWQISPDIMMKGSVFKKQILLEYYNDEARLPKTK